jgi:hypothetical protein
MVGAEGGGGGTRDEKITEDAQEDFVKYKKIMINKFYTILDKKIVFICK